MHQFNVKTDHAINAEHACDRVIKGTSLPVTSILFRACLLQTC